jgi:hypothetical protein
VEFEKMTWVEVKAALAAGKTTALVYTSGVEERDPQDANGGHNLMAHATVEAIARELGNTIFPWRSTAIRSAFSAAFLTPRKSCISTRTTHGCAEISSPLQWEILSLTARRSSGRPPAVLEESGPIRVLTG